MWLTAPGSDHALDDPWRNLMHEVQAVLFPRHPYSRPVIGFTDTLAGAVEHFRTEPAGELDDEEPVLSLVHLLA